MVLVNVKNEPGEASDDDDMYEASEAEEDGIFVDLPDDVLPSERFLL